MSEYPSVTKFMATKLITFTPETDIHTAIDTMVKKKKNLKSLNPIYHSR